MTLLFMLITNTLILIFIPEYHSTGTFAIGYYSCLIITYYDDRGNRDA